MATINELTTAYMEELEAAAKANPHAYPWMEKQTATPAIIAARMFKAAFKSNYPSDWLKHNEALRRACKRCGITKSAEFRDFIKANWVSPFAPEEAV